MEENIEGQPPVNMNPSNEVNTQRSPIVTERKRRGPRTAVGMANSSINACRHGLLCKVAILKGESKADFDTFLKGLWEDLRPAGSLEEFLVEKLGILSWRYRRLISAEGAEIQMGGAFLKWDRVEQEQMEAADIIRKNPIQSFNTGDNEEVIPLMRRITNPKIRQRCLELLKELKVEFEKNGFNWEFDVKILRKLFGHSEHWVETLVESYQTWSQTAGCSKKEREKYGYATEEQCKSTFLDMLEAEITRLDKYATAKAYIESERTRLKSLARNVPDALQLDRLLRYEASLERAFDRTLNQLERLQRIRLGHSVPPPINVNVSTP